MTRTEVVVVVIVVAVLIILLNPVERPGAKAARRAACINNLKQIGIAFRIWGGDHGRDGETPIQYSVKWDGALELVETGNVASVFQVMSNEMKTPKLLICPADTSYQLATNWTTDFGNRNISYFVGLDTCDENPSGILTGDDNLEISNAPAKSGVVQLSTKTPIAWTGARHRFTGNIGLSDGSVQTTTTASLSNAIVNQGEVMFIKKFTADGLFSGYSTNRFRIAIP